MSCIPDGVARKEKKMSYVISTTCTGEDNACVEACPYGCIHPTGKNSAADAGEIALETQAPYCIDPEQCTHCGACALVCPQSAIAPAAAFGYYAAPATAAYGIGELRITAVSA